MAWLRCVTVLGVSLLWIWACPQKEPPLQEPVPDAAKPSERQAAKEPPAPRAKALPRKWVSSMKPLDVSAASKYRYLRTIVHLHSVYSHDACDGNPHVDGKKNLPCLKRLREALCHDAIDVAFLTEHKSKMAEGDPIQEMVLHQEGDAWIKDGDAIIGNRFTCPGGHQVMVFPGAENALMPIALKAHPKALTGKDLNATYGSDSKEAIQAFKAAGAMVLIAHTETKSVEYLRSHDLHGQEIYNLHAAIDPRLRGGDLKLEPAEIAVGSFYAFLRNPLDMPHPDLLFLGFHRRIPIYMDLWDKVLAQKLVYGFGGNDSHENVLKTPLSDGHRPDSYARMMRWFSNHLRVQEKTVKAVREALFAGRSLLVFEVLGTPEAFAFYGQTAAGTRIEMGATTSETVASLHVEARHPYLNSEAPVHSTIRLYHIDASGASKVVAEAKDALEYKAPKPGTYRVEVDITPLHLKHLLTDETQEYMRAYPWIHSNPIRIEK